MSEYGDILDKRYPIKGIVYPNIYYPTFKEI